MPTLIARNAAETGRGQMRGAVIDYRLQLKLDLAVLKQALRDLWLRTDGFQMTEEEQQESSDLMFEAARWCFADRHPNHVFSFRQICERSGIDPARGALRLFTGLPYERKREIWRDLRQYSSRLLPRSWQACQGQATASRRPRGRRYLRVEFLES
jgi:hypothetical protein